MEHVRKGAERRKEGFHPGPTRSCPSPSSFGCTAAPPPLLAESRKGLDFGTGLPGEPWQMIDVIDVGPRPPKLAHAIGVPRSTPQSRSEDGGHRQGRPRRPDRMVPRKEPAAPARRPLHVMPNLPGNVYLFLDLVIIQRSFATDYTVLLPVLASKSTTPAMESWKHLLEAQSPVNGAACIVAVTDPATVACAVIEMDRPRSNTIRSVEWPAR